MMETWADKRDREQREATQAASRQKGVDGLLQALGGGIPTDGAAQPPVATQPNPHIPTGAPAAPVSGIDPLAQQPTMLGKWSAGKDYNQGYKMPNAGKPDAFGSTITGRLGLKRGGLVPGRVNHKVADDTIINAKKGEYMIPEEVVSALGKKHFDDLIRKTRQSIGAPQGIGAKPAGAPDNMGRMDGKGAMAKRGFAGGGFTHQEMLQQGLTPAELREANLSGKPIELGPKPSIQNPPALRGETVAELGPSSEVESPVRPARRVYGDPVGAPRGGGVQNAPAIYKGNPQGFTYGDGVVRGTPNLPQTQSVGVNRTNLPQVRPPQSFGSGRIIPDLVVNSPKGYSGAQPIDASGGLAGLAYRKLSGLTRHTDKLGETTRRTVPGLEQMWGGFHDDATFKDAHDLVRDARRNQDGIPVHENKNDPKEVFGPAKKEATKKGALSYEDQKAKFIADEGGVAPESWKNGRYDTAGGYMELSGKGALSSRKGKNADGTSFDNDAAWSGIRSRQNDRDKRAAFIARGNEREAEVNRFNAMEKERENNRGLDYYIDSMRNSMPMGTSDKTIAQFATDAYSKQEQRNAAKMADATTRRGQDETTEWRKQQSTDALEGRKFQAEQGRLGREAITSEGALNRADTAKARAEEMRYKVNAESEAKANELIKEAGVAAEKVGKDPEEAMYRMQAQLGRGTYKKGALAKKDTSRFWQSDNSEPEIPYSYTPNRTKTASAGKDRPGLKYLGVGDNGEMVYLNAKGEQVTD